jgi:hypothetical protein
LKLGVKLWRHTGKNNSTTASNFGKIKQTDKIKSGNIVAFLLFLQQSKDTCELRLPLQIHILLTSQSRYGTREETIAQKKYCYPLALPIIPATLTLT